MGRPYRIELAELDNTLKWAMGGDVSPLCAAVAASAGLPLLAIGSGGSLSLASLVAALHRGCTGRLAEIATPLEARITPVGPDVAIWFFSAGGGNPDIVSGFLEIVRREPKHIVVLCGRSGSPLAEAARAFKYVDVVEYGAPAGRDGFLATNSLVCAAILVARAYATNFGTSELLSGRLDRLFLDSLVDSAGLRRLQTACVRLWERDTTVLLHGPTTRCGATDVESKFTEAALGTVQLADFRNFAHGRHHWLAKRGDRSGVLAISTRADGELGKRTLRLIPRSIPRIHVELDGDAFAAPVASLVLSIHLAGWAAAARGLDPGRPGVPEFGRRLYHMRTRAPGWTPRGTVRSNEAAAIARKVGVPLHTLEERTDLPAWRAAYRAFCSHLSAQSFAAVVFDYDGTLVDPRSRSAPPADEVVGELRRLLDAGLPVGIATGRGASVRRDLQRSLPRSLWPHVTIGYYSGGDIGRLDDDSRPDRESLPRPELVAALDVLHQHPELEAIACSTVRPLQITLEPRGTIPETRLWEIAQQVLRSVPGPPLPVVRSSHSIDILALGISKRNVVDRIRCSLREPPGPILVIGDRGRWPGNDHELLGERSALSVDEVSVDPATCWNLAPQGHRGVQALLDYCAALSVSSSPAFARLRLPLRQVRP